MINSVSSVSFRASNDAISRPGAYTKPQAQAPAQSDVAPKKKGGFLKGLAKLVALAVVVGGGLLLGTKKGAFKVLDETAGAGIMKKAGHYLAKAGNWIDGNIWQKIPGVAKKAAEEVAEGAEKAAEAVA